MPAHERKAELTKQAVVSYLEMGLGRAGHGDVAKRASVSTGTVFNYFPTREHLTEAVLDSVQSRILVLFDEVGPPTDSILENVFNIKAKIDQGCAEEPDVIKLYLSWTSSFNPELRADYLAFHNQLLDRAAPYLTPPGGDVGMGRLDAQIMVGVARIYMQMVFEGADAQTLDAFVSRIAVLINSAPH